jgi:flap endonuclease-1
MIELQELLGTLSITREQLVDLAILVGTDFNTGIKGIGPKTGLKLIKKHERLENFPKEYEDQLPSDIQEVRRIFLQPTVTNDYEINYSGLNEEGLRHFLCDERGFSEGRVELAVKRMKVFYQQDKTTLAGWFRKAGT